MSTEKFKIVIRWSESRYLYEGSTFRRFMDFDKAAAIAMRCEKEFDNDDGTGYRKTDFTIYMDGCEPWTGCYCVGNDLKTLFEHVMAYLGDPMDYLNEEQIKEHLEAVKIYRPKFEEQYNKENLKNEIQKLKMENQELSRAIYKREEDEKRAEELINEYASYHFETDKNDQAVVVAGINGNGTSAEVVKGVSIRLYETESENNDITYYLGYPAIYDSYNLYYFGRITKITDKNVFIEDNGRTKRLTLHQFSHYNRDGHEKAYERNHQWRMSE